MKKFFVFIACSIGLVMTLNAQSSPANQLAQKIAEKMRDTLSLTSPQYSQVYDINMRLHEQKMQVRQQQDWDRERISKSLQQVENTRDSLYGQILTEEQYRLYRGKKRNLISSN